MRKRVAGNYADPPLVRPPAIAVGRDYLDAAPVGGARQDGGAAERMQAKVVVRITRSCSSNSELTPTPRD